MAIAPGFEISEASKEEMAEVFQVSMFFLIPVPEIQVLVECFK